MKVTTSIYYLEATIENAKIATRLGTTFEKLEAALVRDILKSHKYIHCFSAADPDVLLCGIKDLAEITHLLSNHPQPRIDIFLAE